MMLMVRGLSSRECTPLSRRARAAVVILCFAAIIVTAFLARDLRDVAASMALGLLFVLIIQIKRGMMP